MVRVALGIHAHGVAGVPGDDLTEILQVTARSLNRFDTQRGVLPEPHVLQHIIDRSQPSLNDPRVFVDLHKYATQLHVHIVVDLC